MSISRRSFVKGLGLGAGILLDSQIALGEAGTRLFQAANTPSATTFNPIPRMVASNFAPPFHPTYLSNGLIGIRPGANPLAQAATAVSGFVRSSVRYEMQALAPAPYPLLLDIESLPADGVPPESMLTRPDLVRTTRQQLDMASGELTTEMTVAASGVTWTVHVLQFACRAVPALVCQQVSLTPSRDASAALSVGIGSAGVRGETYRVHAPQQTMIDLVMGFRSDLSKLGIAVHVPARPGVTRTGEPFVSEGGVRRQYRIALRAGETQRFQAIAAMVSEFYHPEPELEAIRLARWGGTLGFDVLRSENRARWSELWQSRIRISGDADSQKVLDASFFYLHSSVSPSDMTGMAPFGLSQTKYYYGHSFWDTESWCLMPIMLTSPATGRALLEFRLRSLPYAKKMAALYGYRGAQFPWEAAPVGGFDVTPTFAGTGWEEQHITLDVALAFWEYQMATGDAGFLKHATWPVLKNVARWIVSRGIFTARGFEIHNIMGPDEGAPNLNNDAYVNLVAKMVLDAAVACAAQVSARAPSAWQRAAGSMYLPIDRAKNIMLPCDNPPEGRDYPIGGLDMLTVHDPPVSRELEKNTFALEEKLRAQRPPAIGFSTAATAATAAWLGDRARARTLFNLSWKADWIPPFGMIKEMPAETYGCFLTTCGSLLQTALLGFTGLRIRETDWSAYPAVLPEGWTRIEVDRIWVRGKAKRLVAQNGQLPQLTDA